jgi:FkbM family methyltransferase
MEEPPVANVQELPEISTAVLNQFEPWSGTVPAGYFTYFLGNLTRAYYWDFSPELKREYDHERVESFTGPKIDDNIFDWLALLEAVTAARDEFVMIALGAGWGRWLVAAALAARQRPGLRCRLVGVEAEPTHFKWMHEHFRDNGLDPAEHTLLEAAAAATTGSAWFYVGKPSAWYGQSLIHDEQLDSNEANADLVDYNSERARRVKTVDIEAVTAGYSRVDYLHMDIQGAELEFLASKPAILHKKVKCVLIGTHSLEIECGLRKLFNDLHWQCVYDIPLNGQVVIDGTSLTLGDGVQVWINPALV